MIKKYHLCDLFTLLELVLACTLTVMAFQHASPDHALWVFIGGELCDALDGPCARRWPYPDDGKRRFWRSPRLVQITEHVSDILLIGALAFYLIGRGGIFYYTTLLGSCIILIFCLIVEDLLRCHTYTLQRRRLIIRIRRYVYLSGIAIGLAELIFCTSWILPLKLGACLFALIVAILLIIFKWNRFTETNEKFRDFLRRKNGKHSRHDKARTDSKSNSHHNPHESHTTDEPHQPHTPEHFQP